MVNSILQNNISMYNFVKINKIHIKQNAPIFTNPWCIASPNIMNCIIVKQIFVCPWQKKQFKTWYHILIEDYSNIFTTFYIGSFLIELQYIVNRRYSNHYTTIQLSFNTFTRSAVISLGFIGGIPFILENF